MGLCRRKKTPDVSGVYPSLPKYKYNLQRIIGEVKVGTIKKYLVPILIIFVGTFICNWAFIKYLFWPIVNVVNYILSALALRESIFYFFSEILICAAFGIVNFIATIFVIGKINRDKFILPCVSIWIPLIMKIIFWGIHFYSVSNVLEEAASSSIFDTIQVVTYIITPDIVYFISLIWDRRFKMRNLKLCESK